MEISDSTVRLLLVDDQPENIHVLNNFLSSRYQVHAVTSGDKALEYIGTNDLPDLVLLDVMMPGMDGYETCRQIRSLPEASDLDIIFISAMDSLEHIISGYEAGGRDYLTKPVEPEELLQKVKLALDQKQLRQQQINDKSMAMQTAMTAITNAGELGVVIGFMRNSFIVNSIEQLASLIVESCSQYGLNSSVQLRTDEATFTACNEGDVCPLETSLLEKLRGAGRLREKDDYFVANFGNITLLVKNMPSDEDYRGRLRDHLAIIVEGAEARLKSLAVNERLKKIVHMAGESLLSINRNQHQNKESIIQIVDSVLDDLHASFLSYGLTEEQELILINVVEEGTNKTIEAIAQGNSIDEELQNIITMLENCTNL